MLCVVQCSWIYLICWNPKRRPGGKYESTDKRISFFISICMCSYACMLTEEFICMNVYIYLYLYMERYIIYKYFIHRHTRTYRHRHKHKDRLWQRNKHSHRHIYIWSFIYVLRLFLDYSFFISHFLAFICYPVEWIHLLFSCLPPLFLWTYPFYSFLFLSCLLSCRTSMRVLFACNSRYPQWRTVTRCLYRQVGKIRTYPETTSTVMTKDYSYFCDCSKSYVSVFLPTAKRNFERASKMIGAVSWPKSLELNST